MSNSNQISIQLDCPCRGAISVQVSGEQLDTYSVRSFVSDFERQHEDCLRANVLRSKAASFATVEGKPDPTPRSIDVPAQAPQLAPPAVADSDDLPF